MIQILRSYTDQDLSDMRLAMAQHYRAFLWPREAGGRAYEYTLKSLFRRLNNYWGDLFQR